MSLVLPSSGQAPPSNTMELDPVFLRALRLLHSRSKDSASQLRTMLDEAIRHRKGLGPGPTGLMMSNPGSGGGSSPSQSKRSSADLSRRDASDRRNLDKLKLELSELVGPAKRPRLDSPRSSSAGGLSSKSHTPSPTPPPSRGDDGKHSSSLSGGNSEEELDLEINLEGLNDCTCCICKSFNQENGNKLMECHTCQELYHQECHSPAVSNDEANDPRLVWNCSQCSVKAPVIDKPSKGSPSSTTSSSSSSSTSGLKTSGSGSSRPSPHKSASSGGGGKPAGMAAMYKSSSGGKSSSSSSRSSRGSSSSKHHSSSSSSSASSSSGSIDKRLQMMKKKAAAKKSK